MPTATGTTIFEMLKHTSYFLLIISLFACATAISVLGPHTVRALSEEQKRVFDSGIGYFNVDETTFLLCSSKTNLVGSDNAEKIWNYMTTKNLTPIQTAGIMGNLQAESGFDPAINEKNPVVSGSRGGYGIAQWTGGRRVALENFAKDSGRDVSSLDLQLDYMWHEFQNGEKAAYEHLLKQTTVPNATQSFLDKYERAGVRRLDERIGFANDALAQYGSNSAPASSGGTSGCESGQVVGGYSLPVDRSHYDEHPEWFTKPHHDYAASDIPVPHSTPIYSMSDGVITSAPVGGACGKGVIVDAGDGVQFKYCHGADGGAFPGARIGDQVGAGQQIMFSSYTGTVQPPGEGGAHLHLEVIVNGEVRCPQTFLVSIADGEPIDVKSLPSSGCIN